MQASLVKAGRVVREYALTLARELRRPKRLREVLRELVESLTVSCRVNTRKTHPNHCQLIAYETIYL